MNISYSVTETDLLLNFILNRLNPWHILKKCGCGGGGGSSSIIIIIISSSSSSSFITSKSSSSYTN